MESYNKSTTYDFFFPDFNEFRNLPSSPLETDLFDLETRKPLGKKIRLQVGDISGDAQHDLEPVDACWEDAKKIIITIRDSVHEYVLREGDGRARLEYGDVFFHQGKLD